MIVELSPAYDNAVIEDSVHIAGRMCPLKLTTFTSAAISTRYEDTTVFLSIIRACSSCHTQTRRLLNSTISSSSLYNAPYSYYIFI